MDKITEELIKELEGFKVLSEMSQEAIASEKRDYKYVKREDDLELKKMYDEE